MSDKTNNLALGIIGLAVLGAVVFFAASGEKANNNTEFSASEGVLEVAENNLDLGQIPIKGGLVNLNFRLKNTGAEAVRVRNVATSCMCTEAYLNLGDAGRFGPFGMVGHRGVNSSAGTEIPSGGEFVVEVVFDPLAHGPEATGKIIREIYLETNSLKTSLVTLYFKGEVVKELPKVAGPSLYISRQLHDFGVVKQSGGIVSTAFDVINNGDERVIIESLPTSCGCTLAEIDKKEISPGERAVITVSFDPNLHEEPTGKFFKTVELVSNIKPPPELKIYAEVDLDLGPEAYKQSRRED